MTPVLQRIDDSIRGLAPYQPGRPIAEVARERGVGDVLKLASNENPLGAGAAVREALRGLDPEVVGRYPDSNGGGLRQDLAERLGVGAEAIVLGNGSNEILELLCQLLLDERSSSVYSEFSFIVYPLATTSRRARSRVTPAADYGHDLEAMAMAAQEPDVRLVFVANPNNPTGTCHSIEAIEAFLRKVPEAVLVVLDEAYCEYLPTPDAALALLPRFPNLFVTRTFSKIHGLAGLRVGYGVGDPELVAMINRIRQPFNVNGVAQVAARAALTDREHVEMSRRVNREGLQVLTTAMEEAGVGFIPAYGNFLTFRPPEGAGAVYERMLNDGVIVRRLDEYGLPEWLRVTVGTAADNRRFLDLLMA